MILLSTQSLIRHLILWQQLELASNLEFDVRDTVDWCWKFLVDFNAEKTLIASCGQFNNCDAINVNIDVSFLEEKSSFKMLRLSFSFKLD